MSGSIRPRKIEGWEFFDAHVDACDSGDMAPFEALEAPERQVPEFFIEALAGCRKVLDLGCGGGYPGLYVAPHVGDLVGIDAAPNMIAMAVNNAAALGVRNARFEVGGADGLPCADCEFDGAMLCGLLESMDWQGVHRIMPEVHRVLTPGALLAVLDQDWEERLARTPAHTENIRLRDGKLVLQVVERRTSPDLEVDTRYYINPNSEVHRLMLGMLGGMAVAPSPIRPSGLCADDVIAAEYDEAAQFDARSLAELLESYGSAVITSESVAIPAWGQSVVLATARRL